MVLDIQNQEDIHVSEQKTINTYGLTDLGYKIFLDRYAYKDLNRESLSVGDIVIVVQNGDTDMSSKREVGIITDVNHEKDRVTVITKQGEELIVRRELIDRPLEIDPKQMHKRIAKGVASVEKEKDQPKWEKRFEGVLDDWKFVPGGRIMAMAGTGQNLTPFNCYVINSPSDSRGGIMDTLADMTEIMSHGGGVGINVSTLRPDRSYVKGVNGRSSGSVSWAGLYSYTTGLVEQAGCFASGVRIATDKGLIPIEELVGRIDQGEIIFAHTHKGMRKITDRFYNGVKKSYRITTERGFEISVSENHPMLYFSDGEIVEIRADHLAEGDEILLSNIAPEYYVAKGDSILFEDVETEDIQTVRYDMPKTMSEDLAYLLGFSYGNGTVYRRKSNNRFKSLSLSTFSGYPEIEDRLIESISQVFGYDANINPTQDRANRITITSNHIVKWLDHNNLLKEKAENIRVPEAIFRSDSKSIASFIAGYFDADGSIAKSKKSVKFTSISKEFISGIQMLLSYLGIMSQVYVYDRPEEGWKTLYELSIRGNVHKSRFSEIIPTWKDVKSCIGKRDMTNMYPSDIVNDKYPPKYYASIHNKKEARLSSNQLQKIAIKAIDKYEDDEASREMLSLLNLSVGKIASIDEIGEVETYDITVDDVHLVMSNGFYTHQSRRGALMLMLADWHPDVLDFINAKRESGKVVNANISVIISDGFMKAVKSGSDWDLKFPDTSFHKYDEEWNGNISEWENKGYPIQVHKTVKAKEIWNQIIESAWASAEPGVWFGERMNKLSNSNYYPEGHLIATNPCAEQGLPPNAVCNLGAINLDRFSIEDFSDSGINNVNWSGLSETIRTSVRFLDNVIDHAYYWDDRYENQQKSERRIGLGVMGLADLMIRCGVRYGSEEGIKFIDSLFKFIAKESYIASSNIAKEKGSFKFFKADGFLNSGFMLGMDDDVRDLIREQGIRNVTINTVAPTGSSGTMVGVSTGLEPYFNWEWWRQGRLGWHREEAQIVQEWRDFYDYPEEELPEYFVNAMELTPKEHVNVLGAIQRWIDSSLSKTCNVPNDYTIEQTAELYMHMYDLGAKGGTIYRDGSRDEQVLHNKTDKVESFEDKDKDKDKSVEEFKESVKTVLSESVQKIGDQQSSEGTSPDGSDKPKPLFLANRAQTLTGKTFYTQTPFGKAYITINEDPEDHPFEVFITIGKAGNDSMAEAEVLGRLLSGAIQMVEDPRNRRDALSHLVNQMIGVGGSRPWGFGPNRVLSFEDAIAQGIRKNYLDVLVDDPDLDDSYEEEKLYISVSDNSEDVEVYQSLSFKNADRCPECGNTTLVRVEGCKKCLCGYSEC